MKSVSIRWFPAIPALALIATVLFAGATGSAIRPTSHASSPAVLLKRGISTIWSGYAAANNLAAPIVGSVTSVSGSWTVPTLTCGTTAAYSSMWVGIDGYTNSTVEQIGTDSNCSSGSQVNDAWFEMFPQPAFFINHTVTTGDVMTASVVYTGNGNFTLTLDDTTADWSFSTTRKSNKAQRTTAEWILEAPGRSTLPLADFGTASFTDASATIGGSARAIDGGGTGTYDAITKVGAQSSSPGGLTDSGTAFSLKWSDTSDNSYVAGVSYSLSKRGGTPKLLIGVQIIDNLDDAVSGVDVTISVSGPQGPDDSTVTTGSNGLAVFTIGSPPSGTYSTTVTGVIGGPPFVPDTPPNSYTVR